jgi:hypothetical protein
MHGDGVPGNVIGQRQVQHYVQAAESMMTNMPHRDVWWPREGGRPVEMWQSRAQGILNPAVRELLAQIYIEVLPDAVPGHSAVPIP